MVVNKTPSLRQKPLCIELIKMQIREIITLIYFDSPHLS
ncbi:hypothetical protein Mmol_1838 [Methylotenera mobilis JLW8]|uniref:Uncharacterized protein n=1 Tax=Methylotenera mobilis (strain JLW8 / ATCC BAA-1282 / DSM 17540) TaxID=583345 RepID=C6WXU3_METML|nr:hypothetical protein Mmol_1838 [Methylotenera mobilis JLW8]